MSNQTPAFLSRTLSVALSPPSPACWRVEKVLIERENERMIDREEERARFKPCCKSHLLSDSGNEMVLEHFLNISIGVRSCDHHASNPTSLQHMPQGKKFITILNPGQERSSRLLWKLYGARRVQQSPVIDLFSGGKRLVMILDPSILTGRVIRRRRISMLGFRLGDGGSELRHDQTSFWTSIKSSIRGEERWSYTEPALEDVVLALDGIRKLPEAPQGCFFTVNIGAARDSRRSLEVLSKANVNDIGATLRSAQYILCLMQLQRAWLCRSGSEVCCEEGNLSMLFLTTREKPTRRARGIKRICLSDSHWCFVELQLLSSIVQSSATQGSLISSLSSIHNETRPATSPALLLAIPPAALPRAALPLPWRCNGPKNSLVKSNRANLMIIPEYGKDVALREQGEVPQSEAH
ncbi:hypothetical protein DNTS_021608 [Danionella cerebrum]|uniref:Uncharacterized protein n=1 Tax=Danionella cerebrum TaxID=2873325 RepID=A0A553QXP1_9TELE|nr:hypothetical protein DNTS_021608 [Danionella translucida]